MRINEIMLNEGFVDSAKSAFKNTVNKDNLAKAGNFASDVGDFARSALYKTTGFGGDPANASATRIKFLNDFKQELALSQRSGRKAGQEYDNGTFVNQYIKRYGWTIDPEELSQLMAVKDDPTKLSNAMYNIAVGQRKGTGQYASTPTSSTSSGAQSASAGNAETSALKQQVADLSSMTQQLMDKIEKMQGSSNYDDLRTIAKKAMQTLYAQSPGEYNKLYSEITRQGKNKFR
jgi:hypothetical protein